MKDIVGVEKVVINIAKPSSLKYLDLGTRIHNYNGADYPSHMQTIAMQKLWQSKDTCQWYVG